jgi:hypothetical protein
MSLVEGLLLDNLLETTMLQEVWLANRTDYADTLKAGAGIELDPFQAKGAASQSDPPFDQVMRALSTLYTLDGMPRTVRLLPGTYYTRGSNSSYSGVGWQPFSGLRIVGSSIKSTTIKLCDSLASGSTVAVGSEIGTPPFLDSFEISDLTIDASSASAPSNSCQNGIGVRGKNIFINRVRVTNFGSSGTSSDLMFGISAGRTTGSSIAENCVIDSCIVDTPKGAGSGKPFGLHLARDTGNEHIFCVIRNNYVDMNQTAGFGSTYVGIGVSGGIGTIVEYNRVLNCKTGAEWPNTSSTTDLIFRHNYFRNVDTASFFELVDVSQEIGRLIYLNNIIEWAPTAVVASPYGLRLNSAVNANGKFKHLVVRDNIMRRQAGEAANGSEQGVYLGLLTKWENLVVDNNLIEVGASPDKGVSHPALPAGATVKPFNNLEVNSTFLAAHNRGTSTHDAELTSDVEALIMGL